MRANRALYATASYLQTETYFDYITIAGLRYSGRGMAGPSNSAHAV